MMGYLCQKRGAHHPCALTWLIWGLFALQWRFASSFSKIMHASAEFHATQTGRGGALDASPWPTDHGDSARGKFTFNAGLPAFGNNDTAGFRITGADTLSRGQWLYTRGNTDIYVLRGGALAPELVRVDAVTMEIVQEAVIPSSMYIGGALIHGNGDVYLCQGNKLFRYKDGDLTQFTMLQLPAINGGVTQTNGMLAANDGYLVIKQWALSIQDLPLFYAGIMPGGVTTLFALPIFVALIVAAVQLSKSATLAKASATGLFVGGVTAVLLAMGSFGLVRRIAGENYNVIDMITMKYNDFGNVVIVDPENMRIVTTVKAPERCSYARMAIYPGNTDDHDWIITLGDYSVMKWKYNHADHKLELQSDWTERYRSFNDGSFYGTGPAVYNGTVYYTDNTFPVQLGNGYRLYAKPLHSNEPQRMVQLAPNSPGFMFWSVTISPLTNSLIVWDTNNNKIQSRDLHDLSLIWQLNVKNTDCLSVAADKGHVYATETTVSIRSVSDNLFACVFGGSIYKADKYFLTIDAATGDVIHRIRVVEQGAMIAGLVAPGANDDVIVTTSRSLLRIHYNATDVTEAATIVAAHDEL